MNKDLDNYIKEHQKLNEKTLSFVEYLYKLMNKYHIDNPSYIYTRANISKQLWSSIICEKSHPSLTVCLKIAFVMHLNNSECKLLLKKAGFTLASQSKYNLIIRYCIENKIYDLNEVNNILIEYGYIDSLID